MQKRHGYAVQTIPESHSFRFGAGPRIYSTFAVYAVLSFDGRPDCGVVVRVSIVPVDVPALLAKNVAKQYQWEYHARGKQARLCSGALALDHAKT